MELLNFLPILQLFIYLFILWKTAQFRVFFPVWKFYAPQVTIAWQLPPHAMIIYIFHRIPTPSLIYGGTIVVV